MKLRPQIVLLLLFLITIGQTLIAQDFFRIKADISVKSKAVNGDEQLTMGTVYYDKNYGKIVYDLHFPDREMLVIKDTLMFSIEEGKVVDTMRTILISEFTIFHLALSNNLKNYGLEKTPYTLDKVEKADSLIISTWIPPQHPNMVLGNILIATKNRLLSGVVFKNGEGEVMSKQFYEDFVNIKGLSFPQKIIQFVYLEGGKKNIQMTTFKNILVNDTKASLLYNYPLR